MGPKSPDRQRFESDKLRGFTESVIREMTRLAVQYGAVNLAQGFPDFDAPEVITEAARRAISDGINQYSITWGARPLRQAIAAKYARTYKLDVDAEREVTVCCGSTEGMIASLMAVTNPGDEIIIFEPFYENYVPDSRLCGCSRRYVRLHAPDWSFDPAELRAAFSPRTKAIIVNSPNNPTGKVFSKEELLFIAELCQEFDCLAITDEIYEHIVYDGVAHIPLMTLPGMRERTILVNSMSKTYSVTGWRVGWVIAAPDLTDSIRKVHDFLTVGAASPLQQAGVIALSLPDSYYQELASHYTERRNRILHILAELHLPAYIPRGAYYVMADIAGLGGRSSAEFARRLVETPGVAVVPGSSFFEQRLTDLNPGNTLIRFCFCKKYETLEEARRRLVGTVPTASV